MFKNIGNRINGLKDDLGDIAGNKRNKGETDDTDTETAYKNALKVTALAFVMLILNLFMGNGIFGTVIFSCFTITGIIMSVLLLRKINKPGQTLPPKDIQKTDEEKMAKHYMERMERKTDRAKEEKKTDDTAGPDDDWIE